MSSGDESVGEIEDVINIHEEEQQQEIVERVQSENEVQEVNAEVDENEEGANDETRKVVKPKRVRNPQPKLNEETLKSARGLPAIESYFERVKFKGRGHEEQDLNVLVKTYEYWCHRLFPKFPFDACISRLETLGTKRATQTQIKKIRMDLNFDDEEKQLVSDDEQIQTDGFVDANDKQFDQLLPVRTETQDEINEDQLERMKRNKERAEKLRQERLRKIRKKASFSLEESNTISNIQMEQDENLPSTSGQNYSSNSRIAFGNYSECSDEIDTDSLLSLINDGTSGKDPDHHGMDQSMENHEDNVPLKRAPGEKNNRIESDRENETVTEQDIVRKNIDDFPNANEPLVMDIPLEAHISEEIEY